MEQISTDDVSMKEECLHGVTGRGIVTLTVYNYKRETTTVITTGITTAGINNWYSYWSAI